MAPPSITNHTDFECVDKKKDSIVGSGIIVGNDEAVGVSVPRERFDWEQPEAQGLYDPQNEHDACGVGFIVAIDGRRSHKVKLKRNLRIVCGILIL